MDFPDENYMEDLHDKALDLPQYYIGCEYCSSGGNVDTIYPDEANNYIF